jgi:PAS domain S-box-containing protein
MFRPLSFDRTYLSYRNKNNSRLNTTGIILVLEKIMRRLFIIITTIYLLISLIGIISISSRLNIIKEKTESLSEAQKSLIKRAEFKDIILQTGKAIEGKRENEISELIKKARQVIDECYNCHHPGHVILRIKETERNINHLGSLAESKDYKSLSIIMARLISFVETAFEKATFLSRTRLESAFNEIKKTEETTTITVITGLLLFLIFSVVTLYRVSLLQQRIKEREISLKNAAEQWRLTFDSIQDCLMIVDEKGRIRMTNESTQEIFGNDITGHPVEEILNLPTVREVSDLYSLQGSFEFSKKERIFSLKTYPYSMDSHEKNLILVIRDITIEKEMEQRLIQAEKLSALSRTMATVATELYNPLTSVTKYSEVLLDLSSINKRIREIADKISTSTSRMSGIVGELLLFSKVPTLNRNPVEIRAMVEGLLRLIEEGIAYGKINFIVSSEKTVLSIDRAKMEKALMSLITYSINRINNSGKGDRIEIKGYEDREKGLFYIDICDNGPIIPWNESLRIFEPFFSDSTKSQDLSTSYRIIKAHGGDIFIKSTENETVFSIELPIN